jgi:intraflagellar transport protein 122
MQFNGEIEREWIFDSKIRSFHIIGGPPRKEGVLVALHSGAILKIFLDNSFPLNLYQHSVPISIANLSLNKRNLAFVDDNKNLTVLDTQTKEIYFTEMNVSSCAFNSDFNDMLAYSGNDMIFIKCSNHQALMQKMKGAVIGL